MEVKSLYEVARGTLITFGIISIFFSEFLLFSPVFSYKPWFFRWTVCLASPIWNGDLVVRTKKSDKMLLSPFQWEASFAFGILSIMGTSVQFVSAIASLLLCSYFYCSLARIAVTSYLSYTVLFPFPYTDFPNLCKGLSHYKWYNLTLQILDLCSSLAIFCTSLGFVMTFARLLQFRYLNMSTGHSREGGLPPVMPLTAARKAAWLCKDRQIPNALTSGSVVPLKPCASFH
uniref:Transmembrane protein 212 n=1 Tax=Bubo bubo TaxID=30461 RepID=A0A8C0EW22_BUBBB